MKKLIVVQWDMQMGPKPLIQYPPEAKFPSKDILLKIWARHEMNADNLFVTLAEDDSNYCSLLKKSENKVFFIILELLPEEDPQTFREILDYVSTSLISNVNQPRFPHVLSETYNTIKSYGEADEQQLLLRLFLDKVRITILEYLRTGCLTKNKLKSDLQAKNGYTNINLDLFLTPFLQLKLIEIQNIPGAEDTIFLIKDFYCARVPPADPPEDTEIKQHIINAFKKSKILSDDEIWQIALYYSDIRVSKLLTSLEEHTTDGISLIESHSWVDNNYSLLDRLMKDGFIINNSEDRIFLLSKLQFFMYEPKYLIPILSERFENGEISINQLIAHVELLQ